MDLLKYRYQRTHLKPDTYYWLMSKTTQHIAGKFVRSYCLGSGEGMTVHLEFIQKGVLYTIDDQMWGSVAGYELKYYQEMTPTEMELNYRDL